MGTPRNDLDLLAVFHYVFAGLCGLFGLLPLVHVAIGAALVTGRLDQGRHDGFPEVFGWLFIAVGVALVVAALACAALVALAGRSLQTRRHWTFCLVMAAVSCAFFPLGTALGVFTILTLSRPEARALFAAAGTGTAGRGPATAPPPPSTPPAGG